MEAIDKYLLPIILGFIAALPGIVGYLLQGKKNKADLTGKFQDIASKEADRMADKIEENERLEQKLESCEKKERKIGRIIPDWIIGIRKLIAQIEKMNRRPVWKPSESDILEMEKIFPNDKKTE